MMGSSMIFSTKICRKRKQLWRFCAGWACASAEPKCRPQRASWVTALSVFSVPEVGPKWSQNPGCERTWMVLLKEFRWISDEFSIYMKMLIASCWLETLVKNGCWMDISFPLKSTWVSHCNPNGCQLDPAGFCRCLPLLTVYICTHSRMCLLYEIPI